MKSGALPAWAGCGKSTLGGGQGEGKGAAPLHKHTQVGNLGFPTWRGWLCSKNPFALDFFFPLPYCLFNFFPPLPVVSFSLFLFSPPRPPFPTLYPDLFLNIIFGGGRWFSFQPSFKPSPSKVAGRRVRGLNVTAPCKVKLGAG